MTDLTPDDFPAHHPEWVQRDHMLIAWAQAWNLIRLSGMATKNPELTWVDGERFGGFLTLDLFGLPILTPELRKRLGDEWRKWKDAQ